MMAWPHEPLRALGTWSGGGTPSKSRSEFWQNGSVPWLSPKDMGPSVLAGTKDHITDAAVAGSATRLVDPNSVAVVVRSGILERTIPVALVPFATTLNQDMKALSCRPGIDPRWVAWGLRANERELLRAARKAGTTVASLEWSRFLNWRLPVPPLAEQQRIVEILEDHLSRLDAADEYLTASSKRVRTYSAATLATLATPDDPVTTLASLAKDSRYGTSTKCIRGGSGVPVVRIPNLQGGAIDLTDEKRAPSTDDLSSLMLKADDLLIVRTNGSKDLIGRTAVVQPGVEAAFASYLIRYRLDQSHALSRWVHLMLERPEGRRQLEGLAASSAGQYNLGLRKLDRVQIPLPTIAEQRARIETYSRVAGHADRVAAVLAASRDRSDALRRSLLTAAFAGRLTGRSSDLDLAEEMALT